MSESRYETEFSWGKGLHPDLSEDALSVKHLAQLRNRQSAAENRAGAVPPSPPGPKVNPDDFDIASEV